MRTTPILTVAALLALAGCTMRGGGTSVTTIEGLVEGVADVSPGITAWLGIPYAASPVGPLRWRPPEPAPARDTILVADRFGNRCVQTNPYPDMVWQSSRESEDCLYLSIWAKAGADKRPVMVWIHGGGYLSGASDEPRHDGAELAGKDVVVVTLNYRLGAFGFLAHPALTSESEHGASGNYGLLDMIAALRWVQRNIAGFGGDPGNVTIFGESAGSFAVSALMASPLSAGLFHRAIGQSGAHMGSGALGVMPLAEAEERGIGALGAIDSETLRALDPAAVISSVQSGGPIVDGYSLPEDPHVAFRQGRQHDVPLMAGWTSAEAKWVQVTPPQMAEWLEQRFPNRLDEAGRFYPHGTDRDAIRSGIRLGSDDFLVQASWSWAELHSRTAEAPVFRFVFDHVMATPNGPVPDDDPGAAHATDIPFAFKTLESTGNPVSDDDRLVADLVATYWTRFAATGDPSAPGLPAWPSYDSSGDVMWLRPEPEVLPDADGERMEFLGAAQSQ